MLPTCSSYNYPPPPPPPLYHINSDSAGSAVSSVNTTPTRVTPPVSNPYSCNLLPDLVCPLVCVFSLPQTHTHTHTQLVLFIIDYYRLHLHALLYVAGTCCMYTCVRNCANAFIACFVWRVMWFNRWLMMGTQRGRIEDGLCGKKILIDKWKYDSR